MPSLNFGDAWPWLQWVIAALALAAFVGACLRGIPAAWKFLSRAVITINSLGDLPEELQKQAEFRETTNATLEAQDVKIDSQGELLATIKHEVLPNNGGSLRDAVDRHAAELASVNEKLNADDIRITKLQARDEQGRFTKKEETP